MNNLECQICFEEYSDNNQINLPFILQCGHTLCYNCINKLTLLRKHCPFCKTLITTKNYVKNYSLINLITYNNNYNNNDYNNTKKLNNEDEEIKKKEGKNNEKKKLFEETIKEYRNEKYLCNENERNLVNLTNLLNQTRAQLNLLETLTTEAQQKYSQSKKNLDAVTSTLQLLQTTHEDIDIEIPSDIPSVLPQYIPPDSLTNENRNHNQPAPRSALLNEIENSRRLLRSSNSNIPPQRQETYPRTIIRRETEVSYFESTTQRLVGVRRMPNQTQNQSRPRPAPTNQSRNVSDRLSLLEEIRRLGREINNETILNEIQSPNTQRSSNGIIPPPPISSSNRDSSTSSSSSVYSPTIVLSAVPAPPPPRPPQLSRTQGLSSSSSFYVPPPPPPPPPPPLPNSTRAPILIFPPSPFR